MVNIYKLLIGAFCMIQPFLCEAISVWDGISYDIEWITKISGNTYHIKTASELAGLSKCYSGEIYLGKNFEGCTLILDEDIDLAGYEWNPIGRYSQSDKYAYFAGTFDGNGHTIKGLSITQQIQSTYKAVGLFSYGPKEGFAVKNLSVQGSINLNNALDQRGGGMYIGAFVGLCYTSNLFENCIANVDIQITQTKGTGIHVFCGGLVGRMETNNPSEKISNCYAKGNFQIKLDNSNYGNIGGIVGSLQSNDFVIQECVSECSINIDWGQQKVGGILGNGYVASINNSLFCGSIKILNLYKGCASGIACLEDKTALNNCIVTGPISNNGNPHGRIYAIAYDYGGMPETIAKNCYYLEDIYNSNHIGIPISEKELTNGRSLEGFDNSIWYFPNGEYPYLQKFPPESFTLNIGLEGGYIGLKIYANQSRDFILTCKEDEEIYQILWNEEDITDQLIDNKFLTTPPISSNSILTIVYKESNNLITDTQIQNIKFIVSNGNLKIYNIEHPYLMTIYNKAGILINQIKLTNQEEYSLDNLPHDVYIIKIGGDTFKIAI